MQGSRLRRTGLAVAPTFVPPVCLAVAMAVGTIASALAQGDPEVPPGMAERFAFDAADTDGDGFVSEAELARDAAAGFSGLDEDRSETLTPQELGPHDSPMFSRIDANGDGVLTFSEVMTNKTRAFEEGDKNKDRGLSFDEMVEAVEAELGAAR
jgi:Ca2+-binding EF-hand superfamily protein